jgi:hypothetical protein
MKCLGCGERYAKGIDLETGLCPFCLEEEPAGEMDFFPRLDEQGFEIDDWDEDGLTPFDLLEEIERN